MTSKPRARLETELVAIVRGFGLAVDAGRRVPFGVKSDGQTRYCAPDVVSPVQQVAAFFDGCYWHRCPTHGPDDAEASAIREKDAGITAALTARGWLVIRVWEHDDLKESAARILDAVCKRHASMKAIHRLSAPLTHKPRSTWCDHCDEEPHAAVPDESGKRCGRCGGFLADHDAEMTNRILSQVDALAEDLKIVSLRSGDDRPVSKSELRELAVIAKRFSRQVEFLGGDDHQ